MWQVHVHGADDHDLAHRHELRVLPYHWRVHREVTPSVCLEKVSENFLLCLSYHTLVSGGCTDSAKPFGLGAVMSRPYLPS